MTLIAPDFPAPLIWDEFAPGEAPVLRAAERCSTRDDPAAQQPAYRRLRPEVAQVTHAIGVHLTAERVHAPLPVDDWRSAHLVNMWRARGYGDMPTDAALCEYPAGSRADLVDGIGAFVPLRADFKRMLHGKPIRLTAVACVAELGEGKFRRYRSVT